MGVLRVNVGGTWVDVAGSSGAEAEVFVGPDDPIATLPTTELWYDTDDPTGGAVATTPLLFATPAARDAAMPAATGNKGYTCTTLDKMRVWLSTGTAWVLIGGVMPTASRSTVTSQTAAIGDTAIIFSTLDFDTDGIATPAHKFTIPITGLWLVSLSMYYASAVTSGRGGAFVVINDAVLNRCAWHACSMLANEDGAFMGFSQVRLNAGDVLDVRTNMSVARNVNNGVIPTRFTVTYLGPY